MTSFEKDERGVRLGAGLGLVLPNIAMVTRTGLAKWLASLIDVWDFAQLYGYDISCGKYF